MTGNAGAPDDTHREIGSRRIAAGEARTAVLWRSYATPIEDVWDACTNPERVRRWFLPVTGDLRAGGTFSLEGNASGKILRCEPPRLLVVTWAYGDRPVEEVEVRLSDGDNGGTVLEVEHASVSTLVELDGRWVDPFLNDGKTGIWGVGTGWEMALVALHAFLRGELPDRSRLGGESLVPPPEMTDLAVRAGAAWAAVLDAGPRASGGS